MPTSIGASWSQPRPGNALDMTSPLPSAVADAIESVEALDPPAQAIGKVVRDAIPAGPVKDALSGTWMGHALHPLLTDIPIGTFTSAVLLDLLGGADAQGAADKLIAIGLAATPGTFVTGWSDWADTEPGDPGVRRSGLLHAALNGTAVGFMALSLGARMRGNRGRGKAYALAGASLLGAGGWLGGHLSYAQGVGVDTTAFDRGPDAWTGTGVRTEELADGQPRCVLAGEVPVLLVRDGGEVRALHNRCSHRAGSLADGEVRDGTVTCPLHGSVFSLSDGSVERGPAAYPQPVLDTRVVTGGEIEVRAPAG
jgi:nitrite reductase/ring-hydroxylating ferredoxin subunit/uncharacterized membrane protein